MPEKPFAEACEQNKDPILAVLREYLPAVASVLEIGSGTGQHAVYFAAQFAHLTWQTSDRPENHPGIRAWIADQGPPNVLEPVSLDVTEAAAWPTGPFEAVFSANTVHIMHWPSVERLFEGVGAILAPAGWFLLYGPFSYDGRHTSDSNARFDASLRTRDPNSGVRDVAELNALAEEAGLTFHADHAMPANNRTLVWRKAAR